MARDLYVTTFDLPEGLTCAAACDAALGAWHLLASRGPRTLQGLAGAGPNDAAGLLADARAATRRLGSFGIVPDGATRRALNALGSDPAGARALRRLAARAGAASLACAAGDIGIERLRSLDGRCGRGRVDRFARRHAWLVPVAGLPDERVGPDLAAALVSASFRQAGNLSEAIRQALGLPPPDGGDPLAAMTRALAGLPLSGIPGVALAKVAIRLPHEWVPRDAVEARALADLATLALALAGRSGGILDAHALIAPGHGRWAAHRDLAAASSPPAEAALVQDPDLPPSAARARLEAAACAFADASAAMAEAFAWQCALPSACRTEAAGHRPEDAACAAADLCSAMPLDPHGVVAGSWRILFGRKGLVAAMRAVDTWTGRSEAMDHALRVAADPRVWKAPFGPYAGPGGLRLVPLASAAELAIEGAALRHCVGSYAGRCQAGETVVISLRRPDGERETRVSTAEIRLVAPAGRGWAVEVVEHKARANGPPGADEIEAVESLAAALADGSHPVSGAARGSIGRIVLGATQPEDEGDALRRACGYDWTRPGLCEAAIGIWGRFVPRDLRGDAEALRRALDLRGPLLGLPEAPPPRPLLPAWLLRVPSAAVPVLCVAAIVAGMGQAWTAATRDPLPSPGPGWADGVPDDELGWRLGALARRDGGACDPGEGISASGRCLRIGEALLVLDGGAVSARFPVDGGAREVFRAWRGAGGTERRAWPMGRGWAGALAAILDRAEGAPPAPPSPGKAAPHRPHPAPALDPVPERPMIPPGQRRPA